MSYLASQSVGYRQRTSQNNGRSVIFETSDAGPGEFERVGGRAWLLAHREWVGGVAGFSNLRELRQPVGYRSRTSQRNASSRVWQRGRGVILMGWGSMGGCVGLSARLT